MLNDAIIRQYKPENMMTEEEKEYERKKVEAEQYVTTSKKNKLRIEMVGFE